MGLPKSIIKKYGISKEAWRVYRGGRSKPHKVETMVKRNRRRSFRSRLRSRFHRIKDKRISIITASTIGAAEAQATMPAIPILQSGDWENGIKSLAHEHLFVWTGINSGLFGGNAGKWDMGRAFRTWLPIIIGAAVSKGLGKHVNPTLSRIPVIGKYVKL